MNEWLKDIFNGHAIGQRLFCYNFWYFYCNENKWPCIRHMRTSVAWALSNTLNIVHVFICNHAFWSNPICRFVMTVKYVSHIFERIRYWNDYFPAKQLTWNTIIFFQSRPQFVFLEILSEIDKQGCISTLDPIIIKYMNDIYEILGKCKILYLYSSHDIGSQTFRLWLWFSGFEWSKWNNYISITHLKIVPKTVNSIDTIHTARVRQNETYPLL